MTWSSLGPTRWKIIVSLLPFLLLIGHLVAWFDIEYGIIPVELDVLGSIVFVALVVETTVAQPFAFLLESLPGFWSYGGLAAFPDGPLLPGSFMVAITYSIILYVAWSLVSAWRRRKG